MLLGVGGWAGCGPEVRTYQVAPYLVPAESCLECAISLSMEARDLDASEGSFKYFAPEAFEKAGFHFRWGVEQRIELEVERYDPDGVQDDPGVRYAFRRLLESKPVEPGSRFEMHFWDSPPGTYAKDLLVRDGAEGFTLGHQRVSLVCESSEVCDALAARRLGEEAFVLELSYPATEDGPLPLHSVRLVP
jgi:hypothetical protein